MDVQQEIWRAIHMDDTFKRSTRNESNYDDDMNGVDKHAALENGVTMNATLQNDLKAVLSSEVLNHDQMNSDLYGDAEHGFVRDETGDDMLNGDLCRSPHCFASTKCVDTCHHDPPLACWFEFDSLLCTGSRACP
eukprot:3270745-Amphidinium_carterae.1